MDYVILVVDDDTANLMLAQKLLGKEYRIAAANSGAAAFKYLENNRPDLILLDINMPEMDGFQVMERLKAEERFASVPVIFLTADKDAD
ncbi:MAG: response regulator, partial [Acetatifactor sp.]